MGHAACTCKRAQTWSHLLTIELNSELWIGWTHAATDFSGSRGGIQWWPTKVSVLNSAGRIMACDAISHSQTQVGKEYFQFAGRIFQNALRWSQYSTSTHYSEGWDFGTYLSREIPWILLFKELGKFSLSCGVGELCQTQDETKDFGLRWRPAGAVPPCFACRCRPDNLGRWSYFRLIFWLLQLIVIDDGVLKRLEFRSASLEDAINNQGGRHEAPKSQHGMGRYY